MNTMHENVVPPAPEYSYNLLYHNTIMHTMKKKENLDYLKHLRQKFNTKMHFLP